MLEKLCDRIDGLNTQVGRLAQWLVIYMMLVQFFVVLLRYVFSIGFIGIVESVWYSYGLLFMLGAGYTLLKDGHVRVDVFYRDMPVRKKALINFWGAILFIAPLSILTFSLSFGYVLNSWKVLEVSSEAGGLPLVFAYKTVIWIFAVLLGLQAISMAGRAWLTLSDKSSDPAPKESLS